MKVRGRRTGSFIATREYRRFVEFAGAPHIEPAIHLARAVAGKPRFAERLRQFGLGQSDKRGLARQEPHALLIAL